MRRRRFLQGSLAGIGALAGGPSLAGFSANVPRPVFTILTGIDLRGDGQVLATVLEAFARQGLPVACIIDPADSGKGAVPADNAAHAVLRDHLGRDGGLIELIAYHRDLLTLTPHAMARAAREVRSACVELVQPGPKGPFPAPFAAIACAEQATPLAPEGLVAAGFGICLAIPASDAPVTGEKWENGTIRMFGGRRAGWSTIAAQASRSADRRAAEITYLSLTDLAGKSPEQIDAIATDFAKARLARELTGEIVLLAVADMVLRDDFDFARRVGLHLFRPHATDADGQAGFRRLKADLARLGFAYSEGDMTPGAGPEGAHGYWLPNRPAFVANSRVERLECSAVTPVAAAAGILPAGAGEQQPGVALRLDMSVTARPGLDAAGALTVFALSAQTALQYRDQFLDGPLSTYSFVLAIHPEHVATARRRAELLRFLRALDLDGVTGFSGLGAHARRLAPQGKLIARYQHAQARTNAARATRPRPLGEDARAAYLADARHAWGYIAAYTDPATGLCASVVERGGGQLTKLETVTMWDVASLLNAITTAQALGLIEREEMQARIKRILPNITGRKTQGRRLPSEWVRTDRPHWGNRNFDACDTGRLLAALWKLDRIEGMDFGIRALVESWDLDKVIIARNLHSVWKGKLLPVTRSHCAHYAARGFRLWGHDVVSPYEVFRHESVTDDRMRLLHVANGIGIYGAEPLLLEGSDYGLTPESDYLADVLFAAQWESYERTGIPVAVSETPLDHAPWFSYQGLVLDRLRDEWRILGTGENKLVDLPDLERSNMVASSKAAYLWAALRPHAYSDRLVAFIRENAMLETGFASGVYTSPQKPMRDYADLNSNAIILHAIGKILAGTAPAKGPDD